MSEEEEKTVEQAPENMEQPAVNDEDMEYSNFLRDTLGEDYDESDEKKNRKGLMDYVTRTKKGTKRISEAMQKDPRFGQALSDVASGRRGAHGALARYFGRDFLTAEEGTPEYDEIVQAEEERLKEMEEAVKSKEEYAKNYEESYPVIEKFCEERGYDVDDFREKIYEKVCVPIFEGRYDEQFLTLLDNAMNYEKDVEDAMKAGEVKGRNMNIQQMRRDKELPTMVQSGGAPINNTPKKPKIGGLIGDATSI